MCLIGVIDCFETVLDFCEIDQDNCDTSSGVYKHMDFTSYEDFKIKEFLDEDRIIIMQKPQLAVVHANNTLQQYPDRWVLKRINPWLIAMS